MVSLADPLCQNTKLRAMALVPKFTGLISLICSTFIIQHILRSPKRRRHIYHRLLLGMSTSDCVVSICCFLGTWPIPRGEACLAAGTTATCTPQGFFGQTGYACATVYNISLAIYYMLVIVKGWTETRVLKVEKYLHALPILVGFGTGFAALGLKLYNNAGWLCWIAPNNDPERNNPNYGIYRLAFLYGIGWFAIVFLAISMTIIYFHVLKQEKRLDNYNYSMRFSQKKRKQSRKIRNQAFLYVGCMYITWIFATVRLKCSFSCQLLHFWYLHNHLNFQLLPHPSSNIQTFRFMQFAGKTPPTFIVVLFVTFFPLQGFFTLVVYMYPRILLYVSSFRKRKTSFFSSFSISRMSTSQVPGAQTSCVAVYDERVENGESGAAHEVDVNHGHEDEKERDDENRNNAKGEENSGDNRKRNREKDAIDELENIVET